MARSLGISIENSFVKGLVTENSGLNFPENACVDVLNCTFTEKGEIHRRDAVDVEDGFVTRSLTINSSDAIKPFLWKGAGKNADINFIVNQIGSTLHFWKDTKGTPLSDTDVYFTFDMEGNKVPGAPSVSKYPVCFASGNSKLFVAHRYMEPFYIEYNDSTGVISYTVVNIQIRDFQVLNDGFKNDETPSLSNNEHYYNLLNQGWSADNIASWKSLNYGTEPAKTMLPWYYRDPNSGSGKLNFYPAYRYRFQMLGTTLAPRGALIYDAYNIDRSSVSGLSGLDSRSCGYERPSFVIFMNSRVFYTGIQYEGYQSTIYFSNILKDTSNEIFFYQKSDPTAEAAYELLANDGGVIVIPDAEGIIALAPSKMYLMVFCNNGVWSIAGSQGVGFSATDYTIEKVSDVPIQTPNSLIIVDHSPMWWNSDGIYTAIIDGMQISTVSVTKGTIQTFYDTIPNNSKRYAQAFYNRLTSEIIWLYSSNESTPQDFDSALVFRAITKAFYKHSFSDSSYTIKGALTSSDRNLGSIPESVLTTSGGLVLTNSGEPTVIEHEGEGPTDSVFTFFLLYDQTNSNITFGTFIEGQTIDWLAHDGTESFDSYLDSGYRVRGDALKKFQVQYLTVYSRYVENSSCKLSGIWDYSSNELSNGFTVEQEVCTNDSRRTVNFRRLRLRGSGLTLQFRLKSVGGAPFHIIGWSCQELVNDRS